MKRIVSIIVLAGIFALSAAAESASKTEKYSSFTGVVFSGNIIATLQQGNEYAVKMEADARIMDYVKLSLMGTVLTIEVLEKDFPNALKAQLRRKDNALLPTNVTIIAPFAKVFDSIVMSGNSRLTTKGEVTFSNNLSIKASSNSSIIDAEIKAEKLELNMANNSSAVLSVKATDFEISSQNNSNVKAQLNAKVAKIGAWNNADVTVLGAVEKLIVTGKNNSSVDALQSESKNVEIDIANNCECNVKAVQVLDIVSAVNGARLNYMGEPVIKIGCIRNSSVSSASQTKEK